MHKEIKTALAPAPIGPYSQAIEAGGIIFSSGQIALDPDSGLLVNQSLEAETQRVMENIKAVLEASGLAFSSIVSTCIYLTNLGDFARVNEIYGSFFLAPFPARTTVQVSALPKGASVEISFIARS